MILCCVLSLTVDIQHSLHHYHTLPYPGTTCSRFQTLPTSFRSRSRYKARFWYLNFLTSAPIIYRRPAPVQVMHQKKMQQYFSGSSFQYHWHVILQHMVSFPNSTGTLEIPISNEDCLLWNLNPSHLQDNYQNFLLWFKIVPTLCVPGQDHNEEACVAVTILKYFRLPSVMLDVVLSRLRRAVFTNDQISTTWLCQFQIIQVLIFLPNCNCQQPYPEINCCPSGAVVHIALRL